MLENIYLMKKLEILILQLSLTPDEIIEKFENSDVKVKKTGIEHGTLTLVFENQKFEITTLEKRYFNRWKACKYFLYRQLGRGLEKKRFYNKRNLS